MPSNYEVTFSVNNKTKNIFAVIKKDDTVWKEFMRKAPEWDNSTVTKYALLSLCQFIIEREEHGTQSAGEQ